MWDILDEGAGRRRGGGLGPTIIVWIIVPNSGQLVWHYSKILSLLECSCLFVCFSFSASVIFCSFIFIRFKPAFPVGQFYLYIFCLVEGGGIWDVFNHDCVLIWLGASYLSRTFSPCVGFLSNTLTFVCIRFQDWRHHINTAGNKISAIYKVTFCLSNIDTLLRNRVWPKQRKKKEKKL